MNKAFVDYVIRDYEKPLGVATYKTYKDMPDEIRLIHIVKYGTQNNLLIKNYVIDTDSMNQQHFAYVR